MKNTDFFSKRYLVHEQLGSGGEGVVFRATDRLTGKIVAIKCVRIDQPDPFGGLQSKANAERKLLIANEFQILSSLRHPNIISVLDYGFSNLDGEVTPFFTMEYLEEAETVLQVGRNLSLYKKVKLLLQILQALQYLHQRGILHRDLKPANALVAREQVRLLDFGLSTHAEKAQGTSGTLAYMAPEYMQDEPLSPASDLYSLGVIAYELIAGRHPYLGNDNSRILVNILFNEPEFEGIDAPENILRIIERLLCKDPNERYPRAQDVTLELYQAIGQSPPPETLAIRESFLQRATFVGREQEMACLEKDFSEIRLATHLSGDSINGRAWLIGGEIGVGKSRLLSEFRTYALVQGATVLQGRSFSDQMAPYDLWLDPIRLLAVLTSPNEEEASVLKAILADIERVLPNMPFVLDPQPLDGVANQLRLRAVLHKLFRYSTVGSLSPKPLILMMEDIHWAGSESIALLKGVQETVADLPVLIIATYQSEEVPPDFPDQFPLFQHMHMERLDAKEIALVSASMLGEAGKNPDLVALLMKETEGNVLFLVETIRALAEESGRLTEIGKTGLPDSVRVKNIEILLSRRLQRVTEEARKHLPLAAVMGRKLDLALLQSGWTSQALFAQWLLELNNSALIQLLEGNQWAFTHEKIRDLIINKLPPSQLQELHIRAAQLIEGIYPNSPAHYGKLVFHWREAGAFNKEFSYLTLVGKQMLQTSAYREAIAYYQRGLALIREKRVDAKIEERVDFLIGQAAALAHLGDYDQSNRIYHSAQRTSRGHHLNTGLANGFYGLAKNYDDLGSYHEAQTFYASALAIFEQEGNIKGVADAQIGLGRVALRLGAFEEAQLAFSNSLRISREMDNKQGEGIVLLGLGDTARVLGAYTDSKQFYLEAQAAFHSIGNQNGISMAFNNLGVLAETQGLYEEAIAWHQKSLEIKQEIGAKQGIAISLNNIGVVYYSMGDFSSSQRYAEETAAIYQSLNDRQGIADSFNNLALLDIQLADYFMARERLTAAEKLYEEIGDQWGCALVQMNFGKVARELHVYPTASQHFQKAIEISQILKLDSVTLQTLIEHAPILMHAGNYFRAVQHLSHAYHNPKTPGFERSMAGKWLDMAKTKLSRTDFDQACEEGKAANTDEIVKREFARISRLAHLDK